MPKEHDKQLIEVRASSRLHLGFLDLNGALGRRFGSIGVAVQGFDTCVRAAPAAAVQVSGSAERRASGLVQKLLPSLPGLEGVAVEIAAAAPAHVGLGSGTQLALAIARAVTALAGETPDAAMLAAMTGRGRRSGIGIAVFDGGGFVIDGGHGPDTDVPPILARMDFPAHWRFLLVTDSDCIGLSGREESRAFGDLPPAPAAEAGEICRAVLMQLLPGLMEHDFTGVSAALRLVQDRVGDYFAPSQGGRYTSERVAAALAALDGRGVHGIGQSSWGPTGFALLPSQAAAEAERDYLHTVFGKAGPLGFTICGPRNSGAAIVRFPHASPLRREAAGAAT